jgi:hypothetical protein
MYEETNLYSNSDDLILASVSNSVYEQTHYVTIIYKVGSYVNNLMIKEPDKCEKWNGLIMIIYQKIYFYLLRILYCQADWRI